MEYSQIGRPIRVDTPLGDDVLLLEEFTGAEAVSQQFSFHLRAVSTNGSIALPDLLQRRFLGRERQRASDLGDAARDDLHLLLERRRW